MLMEDKARKICKPLKEISEHIYNICVKNGYWNARNVLESEIYSLAYDMQTHPKEWKDMYEDFENLTPSQIRELGECAEIEATFTEDDVWEVLKAQVDKFIETVKEEGITDEDEMEEYWYLDAIFSDTLTNIVFQNVFEAIDECKKKEIK